MEKVKPQDSKHSAMDFFTRNRAKLRLTAIFSSHSFNFFMIYASWAKDENAWITTYIIAGIAIFSALVCQFTKPQPKESNI